MIDEATILFLYTASIVSYLSNKLVLKTGDGLLENLSVIPRDFRRRLIELR